MEYARLLVKPCLITILLILVAPDLPGHASLAWSSILNSILISSFNLLVAVAYFGACDPMQTQFSFPIFNVILNEAQNMKSSVYTEASHTDM